MEEVHKVASFRMSKVRMASVMYAILMSKAKIITSYGVGIYEYTREQNVYNWVDIMLRIHPNNIDLFESLSDIKLKKPQIITINAE